IQGIDQTYTMPPPATQNSKMQFNIGEDIQEGPSRLRIIANYYMLWPDPCIVYNDPSMVVGEVEDYNISFVASMPEVYPTTGNILYNKEKYDGTTRNYNGTLTNFKLPAVEFKGAQPAGTSIEYSISGPLPSREVV